MADVADQDEVVYVFEEDFDSIDPIFCIVETEKYVSWMSRRIPIRASMITTKSKDRKYGRVSQCFRAYSPRITDAVTMNRQLSTNSITFLNGYSLTDSNRHSQRNQSKSSGLIFTPQGYFLSSNIGQ
jgi:hypothetical protein